MINVEESTIIHRPLEDVFAYMTDLRNAPEWQSGLMEMRQTAVAGFGTLKDLLESPVASTLS